MRVVTVFVLCLFVFSNQASPEAGAGSDTPGRIQRLLILTGVAERATVIAKRALGTFASYPYDTLEYQRRSEEVLRDLAEEYDRESYAAHVAGKLETPFSDEEQQKLLDALESPLMRRWFAFVAKSRPVVEAADKSWRREISKAYFERFASRVR